MTGDHQGEQRLRTEGRNSTTGKPSSVPERRRLSGDGDDQPVGSPAGKRRPLLTAAVVAAGVLAAVATAWVTSGSTPQGDSGLSVQAKAERLATFQSGGPLALTGIPDAEEASALEDMALPAEQATALERDLAEADTRLAYVTVWDDYAEDGDVITIESAGFTKTVSLTNAPQRFVVPIAGGMITMRGVRDGGGGITMGAQAAGGPVLVPVIAPGETVQVPVRLP